MHVCDNCRTEFDPAKTGILVTERGRTATSVCGDCCAGVRKAKIILNRGDLGGFNYEQYVAIEMIKKAGG